MLLRCTDHGNQSRHQRKRELYTGGMNKMISDNKLKEFQKNIQIPVSIFCDHRFGVLESLVHHLKKNHCLKIYQIAKILNRDDRTIWTVLSRYKEKEYTEGEGME